MLKPKQLLFFLWSDVSPENAGACFVGETFARSLTRGCLPSRIDAILLGCIFSGVFKAKRLTLPKVLIEKHVVCLFVCLFVVVVG